MSEPLTRMTERAAELRLAFDRAFADPVRLDAASKTDLLAIRLGAQAFAIHLSEIAGLFADKKITHVPGSHAALLGIAGFRGAIIPVYDLSVLLGHGSMPTPRWLVIAAGATVALAFETFEGQLQVPRDAIRPQQARTEMRSYAREFVQTPDLVRPIIHLPSVLAAIKT